MRNQEINNSTIYYALWEDSEPQFDEWGNETGENPPTYSEPQMMQANVSEVRGLATVQMAGKEVDYDATILTHDMTCPVDELSVFYIHTNPFDGETFDYIVRRVATSKNVKTILVKRVDVT